MQVNSVNSRYQTQEMPTNNPKAPSFKHVYKINFIVDGKEVVSDGTRETTTKLRKIFKTMSNAVFNKPKAETEEEKTLVSKIQRFYNWFDKDFSYLNKEGVEKPWLYMRLDFVNNQPYGFSLGHVRDLNKRGREIGYAERDLKDLKAQAEKKKDAASADKVRAGERYVKQCRQDYYDELRRDVNCWNRLVQNKKKMVISAETTKKGKYKIVGMRAKSDELQPVPPTNSGKPATPLKVVNQQPEAATKKIQESQKPQAQATSNLPIATQRKFYELPSTKVVQTDLFEKPKDIGVA